MPQNKIQATPTRTACSHSETRKNSTMNHSEAAESIAASALKASIDHPGDPVFTEATKIGLAAAQMHSILHLAEKVEQLGDNSAYEKGVKFGEQLERDRTAFDFGTKIVQARRNAFEEAIVAIEKLIGNDCECSTCANVETVVTLCVGRIRELSGNA